MMRRLQVFVSCECGCFTGLLVIGSSVSLFGVGFLVVQLLGWRVQGTLVAMR